MKYGAAYVADVVPASGSQPDAEQFYFRHELSDTKAGMAAAKVSQLSRGQEQDSNKRPRGPFGGGHDGHHGGSSGQGRRQFHGGPGGSSNTPGLWAQAPVAPAANKNGTVSGGSCLRGRLAAAPQI
jgi:hypothetical protein